MCIEVNEVKVMVFRRKIPRQAESKRVATHTWNYTQNAWQQRKKGDIIESTETMTIQVLAYGSEAETLTKI
jgi:hypothetical protein